MRTGHVKRLPTIEQQNIVCAAWMEVNPQVCQPEQKITVTFKIDVKGKKTDFLGLYSSEQFKPGTPPHVAVCTLAIGFEEQGG